MKINQFLESTYLKTSAQANISEQETLHIVKTLVKQANDNHLQLVMIRPKFVSLAKQLIESAKSNTLVGTVIGFPEGTDTTQQKIQEATIAIKNGVDELDFVINYTAFLNGNIDQIKDEVYECTKLVLDANKTIKWILEIAALTDDQIISITKLIRDTILTNFDKKRIKSVFIKSSTGFFITQDTKPNGATFEAIEMMVEYGAPLPVKAAGGVRTYEDALKMITLGVTRIGTSSIKKILEEQKNKTNY